MPDQIRKFIHLFSQLPALGPRQATRLAFYISRLTKNEIAALARSLAGLGELAMCARCFFITNSDCVFCNDQRRQQDLICVVEKETDVLSIEKTKNYNGLYLVLGPLEKNGVLTKSQKEKLASLARRNLQEIVLAINHTAYGDLNASLIAKEIKPFAPKITRLGRGIPTGGEIEFADPETLSGAFDNRK